MKAHHLLYRIGSRLGHNLPYDMVCNALIQMAVDQRAAWARDHQAGVKTPYIIVLDNIQVYAQRRDICIGTHNEMLVGTGATAVQMEDCPDGAFALPPVLEALQSGRRREVTVEGILKTVDLDHAKIAGTMHWLDALVSFVPALG